MLNPAEIASDDRPKSEYSLDFRRRPSRQHVDLVIQRAAHLDPPDRALLLAVYYHGRRLKELSELSGMPIRRLRNRVHSLVKRLLQPAYPYVVAQAPTWSPQLRRIGIACFIHGRSVRQAARELGLSYHTTRRGKDTIVAGAAAWKPVRVERSARAEASAA